MMKIRSLLILAGAAALSGCAIHQNVRAVEGVQAKQVCIVENGAVRTGFFESYKRALVAKGYEVRQLPTSASLVECPITSTYTANWRWDLATYLAFVEIKVYNHGKPVGEAKYDSTRGGGNMGKFIDADKKITELVNQLFPGNATGA